MQVRIIHTADVHLDACMGGGAMSSGFGNRRRQSLRDVFASIVSRSGEWPADALLIAGDLFEHERIARDTVAFLRSQFESIVHVPVFITPGNHDPFMSGSPYLTEIWPENVTIFNKPSWDSRQVKEGKLVVHGFAFDGPQISSNPFGDLEIPLNERRVQIQDEMGADGFGGPEIILEDTQRVNITADGAIHVAVAHGSERTHQPPEKEVYAPFDVNESVCRGLSYMAMGHFHSPTEILAPLNTCVYYSGAPEGHSFGETGPRYYLEVEISESGVRVEKIPSARAVYETEKIDCTNFTSAQQLIDAIRELAIREGPDLIMRITLKGLCLSSLQSEFQLVRDAVVDDFRYIEIIDETDDVEDYKHLERSGGSLGAFIAQLNEELMDAPDDDRRRMISRARELGLAAYRGQILDVHGLEGGS